LKNKENEDYRSRTWAGEEESIKEVKLNAISLLFGLDTPSISLC
jgi:hypothetical protein